MTEHISLNLKIAKRIQTNSSNFEEREFLSSPTANWLMNIIFHFSIAQFDCWRTADFFSRAKQEISILFDIFFSIERLIQLSTETDCYELQWNFAKYIPAIFGVLLIVDAMIVNLFFKISYPLVPKGNTNENA